MTDATRALALFMISALTPIARASEVTTYTYDALGRLSYAQVSGDRYSGAQQSYQYDPAGNRTSAQSLRPANASPSPIVPVSARVNSMGAAGGTLAVTAGATGAGGSVAFSINGTFVGTVEVIDGQARVGLTGFAPGTYTVTARYSGDAYNTPATVTFTVDIRDLSWLPAVLQLLND